MHGKGYRLLSGATGAVQDAIGKMTEAELLASRRAIAKLTPTNCGWDVFMMRIPLKTMINSHLHTIRYQRRQAKKAKA